jgi:hypothetical protein
MIHRSDCWICSGVLSGVLVFTACPVHGKEREEFHIQKQVYQEMQTSRLESRLSTNTASVTVSYT